MKLKSINKLIRMVKVITGIERRLAMLKAYRNIRIVRRKEEKK